MAFVTTQDQQRSRKHEKTCRAETSKLV